jgi:hypothetical protein
MSKEQKFDNFSALLKAVQGERIERERPKFKKAVLVYRPPAKPKGPRFTPRKQRLPGYFMQKNALSAKVSIQLSTKIKTSNRRRS